MSTITDLKTRAQENVKDTHSWVSDAAWTQAVKDAVLEYSKKAPMTKQFTVNLQADIDTYTLPAGFLFMVDFPTAQQWRDGEILNTPNGLIPLDSNASYPEEARVQGKSLWVYPTPKTAMDIKAKGAFTHLLDENNEYTTMRDDEEQIVVAKVEAIALNIMARKAAEAVDYSEGDTKIEFSKRAKLYEELALKAEIRWLKMVDKAAIVQ